MNNALHSTTIGKGARMVMAHGFTQTGRVWGSLDRDLATDHQLVLVDLPGHGGSSEVVADLEEGGRLLVDAGGRGTYLGYSMGARFCLHAAFRRPDLVEALVLISGTAGIEDQAERGRRRVSDEKLADELDPSGPGSRPISVDLFVQRWLAKPMFAGIGPAASGVEERLSNTGPGLASSLRSAGTGTQRPLWGSLGDLTMPVLLITGELDEKFTTLGARMAEAIGRSATHAVIPAAGHAPHLEYPDQVAALVRALLSSQRGR
jgi:2-succinyl-6-hydroxy-2,4-cyclohexadiene-1-carboxylate synthase